MLFIHRNFNYGRKNNGDFACETHEFIVPVQFIGKQALWPYFDQVIPPKPKNPVALIGSKALILKHPTFLGYFGKIMGFDEKNPEKLRVKIQKPATFAFVAEENKNPKPKNYMRLNEVCRVLNIEIQTALAILDSLPILLFEDSELCERFGKVIDIGLNLINKHTLKIVPELVICKKLENGRDPHRGYLEFLEFSEEAFALLSKYKENFPNIVSKINQRFREQYR